MMNGTPKNQEVLPSRFPWAKHAQLHNNYPNVIRNFLYYINFYTILWVQNFSTWE